MKLKDITRLRLISQQIAATKFNTITRLVGWMGAMQAQDYAMAKWAIGVRLPGSTDDAVEKAIHSGAIVRTHVLRPTWHMVAATDIPWMLELTAPQIKISMRSRDKELGLTEAVFKKSNNLIGKTLRNDQHFTREELLAVLTKARVASMPEQAWHLLVRAELDGIICSGNIKDQKQTYTLLSERVPDAVKHSKDEALEKLALRYFTSHSPATFKDFAWWSGLTAGDARKGLSFIQDKLIEEKIGTETYYLPNDFSIPATSKASAYLLPAFDEYLISYKDRTAAIQLQEQPKAFTSNGIFRPVVVVNGEVTGIWKRAVKKDQVLIEKELFRPASAATERLLKKEADAFGKFLNKQVVLKTASSALV